jgi:hypothetical protein
MINLSRKLISFFFVTLLSACQTTAPNTSTMEFEDDALRQHKLALTNPTASFNDGFLTISGGVWPTQKNHISPADIDY